MCMGGYDDDFVSTLDKLITKESMSLVAILLRGDSCGCGISTGSIAIPHRP